MKSAFVQFTSGTLRMIMLSALLAILGTIGSLPAAGAAASSVPHATAIEFAYQFASGDHILGFQNDGVFVASATHALHVQFLGTHNVKPVAAQEEQTSGSARPLDKVTWNQLWDGISVSYQASPDGIAESVYTLAPQAAVEHISWRYNAPTHLNTDGSLTLTYADGTMNESAPQAWQEIGGVRTPVQVAFQVHEQSTAGENPTSEVGFDIGEYNPAYPLTIDPRLRWTSLFGNSSQTIGYGIALDWVGGVYVTGVSNTNWGNPVVPYSNFGQDAFVASINPLNGALLWNTFLGSGGNDKGLAIFVTTSNWIYVAGTSTSTWGSPLTSKAAGDDAFVAKLGALDGALSWNTFLGGSGNDWATSVAVDSGGYIYVGGQSNATWGTPVRGFGGAPWDAFVAKLSTTGTVVLWSTFLGGSDDDSGTRIVVDNTNGFVYATGTSSATWGSPLHMFQDVRDVFVAKLNTTTGALPWSTFVGGFGTDTSGGIDVDTSGYVYVTGTSYSSWGSPQDAFQGVADAFVIKLSGVGVWQWMTFVGGAGNDQAMSIRVDSGGNSYIAGQSNAAWGAPVVGYTNGMDGFVAKLSSTGTWVPYSSFLGGTGWEGINAIAVDTGGHAFAAGSGNGTWGSPAGAFMPGTDGLVAKLATNFLVNWNTFLGGSGEDYANGIAVGHNGHIYVVGYSYNTWGTSPRRAISGGSDAFVAEFGPDGSLLHNTFLGGVGDDLAVSITAYGVFDYLYVAGQSTASWSTPRRGYSGGTDTFFAYLDSSLTLQWMTFLGGSGNDYASGIDLNGIGIYLTGTSTSSTWDTTPVHAASGGTDAYIAHLDGTGDLDWYTFLGGAGNDYSRGIVMDWLGNPCVIGYSFAGWGSPTSPYQGGADAFVARVDSVYGTVIWTTFLGGAGNDYGTGIAYDNSSIYVVGYSSANWGSPVRPYSSGVDVMVAKLNQANGVRTWNTFLGGTGGDYGTSITTSSAGDVYVSGYSNTIWGSPALPYTAGYDVTIAKLNSNGVLQWNGFLGGSGTDYGEGITGDTGNLYLTGQSDNSWPVWDGSTQPDVFVTRISLNDLYLPMIVR